jgi:hypothetical protein
MAIADAEKVRDDTIASWKEDRRVR